MKPSLSIVLPCYQPPEGWEEKIIHSIQRIAASTRLIELIIVNDGSLKSLIEEIEKIRQQCRTNICYISYTTNKGKGYAIRTGFTEATGDLIIYTDIDFPYSHESFMAIYETLLDPSVAIAVGIKDDSYYEQVPFVRKWISKILRKMIAVTLNISITDTQCGLKGMRQSSKTVWVQGTINRYLFDLEAIYNASKSGLTMKAVPVDLRPGVQFSTIPLRLLINELKNFIAIVFKR